MKTKYINNQYSYLLSTNQLHKYQTLSTNQLHLCIKIIELQYKQKNPTKLIIG
jgi:hypothetical protein